MILAERITSEWTYQQSHPEWRAVAVWSRPILCLPSNTSPTKHKHSKYNHCVRLSIKRLVQYHTGTCTNLNKTRFLQKMMFFAIITSNIDLDRGVFVKIHAIYVPLIYDNCKAFIITEMQFLLFNTFFLGGGMGVKGCNGGGLIFWYEHILQQLQCARYEFWKWNDQIIKLNTPQHMDKQTRQNLNFSVQSYNICSHNFYYFNH